MKTIKIFVISTLMILGAISAFAQGQWIPFKTGNADRDNINGIAIEGDSIWCATQDGVIRWNKKDGSYLYFPAAYGWSQYDAPVNCISIDHNGVKWFGKNNGILSFDNTTWTQYTSDTVDLLGQIKQTYNLYFWISKIIVSVDNKKYFGYQGIYGDRFPNYVGFGLSFDDQKWENLFYFNNNGNPLSIA